MVVDRKYGRRETVMEQYTGFAGVYDEFMDNVPYDDWADYLHRLLIKNGAGSGIVCELGCGTGKITRRLKMMGYDPIGIDISADMLQIARSHEKPGDESILYLRQDMRSFELYGTVAAIVCICDGMNYIMKTAELAKVFRLALNYLDYDGVFIFDMNTIHYYRDVLADRTICDNREDKCLIWENDFNPRTLKNRFDLTIFSENEPDRFERLTETHFQRAYPIEAVKNALKEAGLKDIKCYRAFTNRSGSENDERVYFVSKKRKPAEKM